MKHGVYPRKIRKRTILLASLGLFWTLLITARLVQLQVIDHARLKEEVLRQNQNRSILKPKRGTIFDRQGTILARSIPRYSVFLQSENGETRNEQWSKVRKLQPILRLSRSRLQNIRKQIDRGAPFIWLSRKIEEDRALRVKEKGLEGVYLKEENKRFYPHRNRAAHVLGRVDIDERGVSGVEYRYNALLEGLEGEGLNLRDAKRRKYRVEILRAPVDGKDIVLTIDETIQYIAEEELRRAVERHRADWGTVIISVPSTGEILAMANHPTYDLNLPPLSAPDLDRNRAIHHTYDPGSTFKVVTACAALESHAVRPSETFDCSEGVIRWGGNTFRDHKRFGILSFEQVIVHSSNVGTIQVGQKVGEERLFRTIVNFGFGRKTGIDLPAEERGLLNPLNAWTEISIASHSIGYEIAVTPIQMLQALNIVANGGLVVPPRVVKGIKEPGNPIPLPTAAEEPAALRRVISAETAEKMQAFLRHVVSEGTGTEADIPGYTVLGKTGTAQKYDPRAGTYLSTAHVSSFMGLVVKGRPLFSMIVVIDNPQGLFYGGQVAAPVFRKIARKVLRYLKVPPDETRPEILIASTTRELEKR